MVVCVAIYVHLCCYGILFCIYHIILATSHKLLSLYHHQTLSTVSFWPSGAWTAWSIQYQCNHQCVLENAEESSDAATASVPEKHHTHNHTQAQPCIYTYKHNTTSCTHLLGSRRVLCKGFSIIHGLQGLEGHVGTSQLLLEGGEGQTRI